MTWNNSIEAKDRRLGLVLLAPAVVLFLMLISWPLLDSLWLSLHHINTLTLSGPFVGLENYRELLQSREFWTSLWNNIVWTIGSVVLQVVVGIGVALLLHQNLVMRSLARGLILFPYLLPMVVAVLVWKWLFNDLYGILNHILISVGLVVSPIDWLGSMPNAMIGVILVGTWKYFPFVVLAVLARLQTIPEQLYEAARVDGASDWARFVDITLPQLKGVLTIVILLRAIWDFKEFDLIFMMTGGGPVIGTQTLPIMVYKHAFPLLQMGKAAAVAVLMMIVMIGFMIAYFRTYGREEA